MDAKALQNVRLHRAMLAANLNWPTMSWAMGTAGHDVGVMREVDRIDLSGLSGLPGASREVDRIDFSDLPDEAWSDLALLLDVNEAWLRGEDAPMERQHVLTATGSGFNVEWRDPEPPTLKGYVEALAATHDSYSIPHRFTAGQKFEQADLTPYIEALDLHAEEIAAMVQAEEGEATSALADAWDMGHKAGMEDAFSFDELRTNPFRKEEPPAEEPRTLADIEQPYLGDRVKVRYATNSVEATFAWRENAGFCWTYEGGTFYITLPDQAVVLEELEPVEAVEPPASAGALELTNRRGRTRLWLRRDDGWHLWLPESTRWSTAPRPWPAVLAGGRMRPASIETLDRHGLARNEEARPRPF